MLRMRDLGDEYRLSFRSIEEIDGALTDLVKQVKRDRSIVYHSGRKPGRAAVINAVLAWLFDQPPERQKAVVIEGMARLTALLGAEAGQATAPPSDPPEVIPARVVEGHHVDPQTKLKLTKGPKRSGRKGSQGA